MNYCRIVPFSPSSSRAGRNDIVELRSRINPDSVGIAQYAIDFHPCMRDYPPEAPGNIERPGVLPYEMVINPSAESPMLEALRAELEASGNPVKFPNTSIFNEDWGNWRPW